ncbi:universal stress protein [Geobacter argillaceus]|uniref:Universal stress protein n=1 Tax=Geobacter argillaceus TaxID=345631 RepID=A0A562V900_9BACT|nr:universal stress protein [Geobacter argillaceus]TWJ14351.1 nucleotide-binding universal stress UspA family protein [Geobacter argillaceus]
MKEFKTILFANDFAETSEEVFDYALSLARKYGAKLLIVHVINEPVDLRGFYVPHISFENLEKEIVEGAEKMMEKFCRTKVKDFADHETMILSGIPYEEIIKKAEEARASLIVMGTHGRRGLDHMLFGSTAERVVRGAGCPVLTVRLP